MIVDANVLISALVGRSFPRLKRVQEAKIALAVPEHQLREVALILRHKFGLAQDVVAARLALLATLIEPIDQSFYRSLEPVARQRLESAGQRDWPVLATAIALHRPILSNDRDFFGVGVPVWTPRNLDRELETMNA